MIVIESVLIIFAIAIALAYLIWSFISHKKNKTSCADCSSTGSCKTRKDHC